MIWKSAFKLRKTYQNQSTLAQLTIIWLEDNNTETRLTDYLQRVDWSLARSSIPGWESLLGQGHDYRSYRLQGCGALTSTAYRDLLLSVIKDIHGVLNGNFLNNILHMSLILNRFTQLLEGQSTCCLRIWLTNTSNHHAHYFLWLRMAVFIK